ncbi:protein YohO [Izhakiella australiensis]|nr:protein YohO [Izhakiella australiensis]
MNWQKIAVTLLFLFMAIGGVGGVMLVGYSVIIHAR